MAKELSLAGPGPAAPPEPWSHNLHYHRVIVDAIAGGCERALELAAAPARSPASKQLMPHVTGIDRDERSIQLARAHPGATGIRCICRDTSSPPRSSLPRSTW